MADISLDSDDLEALARQALAGRVARQLTHEINDLLVGVVSVAEEGLETGTMLERRRCLQTIIQSGRQIAEQVRAFQEVFSRTAAPERARPVSLARALERALTVCRKRIRQHGVTVRRKPGNLPRVNADVAALEQILVELLYHALDHMPNGGTLKVTAERGGETVVLTVSGTGGGASTRDAGRDLEPRKRRGPDPGDAERPDTSGREPLFRGFGLAVARAMTRRLGGELVAESTLGRSSRITLRLPAGTESGEAECASETS